MRARKHPPAVRGRFNVLSDGRVGKFGRKAQTATAIYEALETRDVGYAIRIPPTRIWSWQSKTSCFGRRVGDGEES